MPELPAGSGGQAAATLASFPPGTPVCVKQTVERRSESYVAETVGVVEAWEEKPTGSWYAHGKDDSRGLLAGKLWLARLMLRKADGELTLIVVDDTTEIAKLEAGEENV